MKTGKIFPVSVFLSCCCLEAFASAPANSTHLLGRSSMDLSPNVTALENREAQQSNSDVKVAGRFLKVQPF